MRVLKRRRLRSGVVIGASAIGLPVVVASPPLGREFVFLGTAIHPRLEVGSALLALVLQEILVAALPELELADLIPALGEHHVFLGVSGRGLLRFVETGKKFPVVADLAVRGSCKARSHGGDSVTAV